MEREMTAKDAEIAALQEALEAARPFVWGKFVDAESGSDEQKELGRTIRLVEAALAALGSPAPDPREDQIKSLEAALKSRRIQTPNDEYEQGWNRGLEVAALLAQGK
jgi:hypothetical protein